MEIPALVAYAVGAISPHLAKLGESTAEKLGEGVGEAPGKILAWMREKLGGRAREALDDLEQAPASEDNQADLRKQLIKALQADPALAEELAALRPQDAVDASAMVQNVSGAGAKAIQQKGSGNTATNS